MEKTFQGMGISGIESEEDKAENSGGWMWSLQQNMMAKKDILTTNILSNLKFKFSDIKLKIEIENTFVCGINIDELEGRNTNETWSPIEEKATSEQDNFKLVEMKNLSVYWYESEMENSERGFLNLEEIRDYFELKHVPEEFKSKILNSEFNLIDPVYAQCRIQLRKNVEALTDLARNEFSMLLTKIKINLRHTQYRQILQANRYLTQLRKKTRYHKNRPDKVKNSSNSENEANDWKSWWKWAGYHCSEQKREKREQNQVLYEKLKQNLRYVKLYEQKLLNLELVSKSEGIELKQIERNRPLKELKILRQAVYEKIVKNSEITQNSENSDSESPSSIDSPRTIDLSQLDSIDAYRDDIFIKSVCTIQTGELSLITPHEKQTISFDGLTISNFFQQKTKSKTLNIKLEHMKLPGILSVESDNSPDSSKNGIKTPINSKYDTFQRQNAIKDVKTQMVKSEFKFTSLHSKQAINGQNDPQNPKTPTIFTVSLEQHEKHSKLEFCMLPVEFTYNQNIVNAIKLFFRPPRRTRHLTEIDDEKLQFDFADATREKFELVKEQAKNQLVSKWRELTEGGGARTFGSIESVKNS